MSRFRVNGVKREHGTVAGAVKWLERLAALPGVHSVIPGRIKPTTRGGRRFRVQYETPTGLKVTIQAEGGVQEVFVVTDNPAAVRAFVEASNRE